MSIEIIWPWRMVGQFEDGEEIYVNGWSEEDCMGKLGNLEDEHGPLTFWSGATDENYCAGELIPEEDD